MNLKNLKKEFFYWRQAFWHGRFFQYFYGRYFLAPRILRRATPLFTSDPEAELSIHLLLCHRDVISALWCLASWGGNGGPIGQLYLHDDGTLTAADVSCLKRLLPNCLIIHSSDFWQQATSGLQAWPILAACRRKYKEFSFKKIIDPYFVADTPYHLIMDADILWFNQPKELIKSLQEGVPGPLLQDNVLPLSGQFIDGTATDPQRATFNDGLVLYRRDQLSLEILSEFFSLLDWQLPRNRHFADQLGYANALPEVKKLPTVLYRIKGQVEKETIAKHYTSPRRWQLFAEGLFLINRRQKIV